MPFSNVLLSLDFLMVAAEANPSHKPLLSEMEQENQYELEAPEKKKEVRGKKPAERKNKDVLKAKFMAGEPKREFENPYVPPPPFYKNNKPRSN